MEENKEQKIDNNKAQKRILKLDLKTFTIIAVAVAIIAVVVISLVYRIKKEREQLEKDRAYVAELFKKNEIIPFTQKHFEQKYMDLYSIVRGEEKKEGNITYSYKCDKIKNSIENAVYHIDVNQTSLQTKLNLIYKKLDDEFNLTHDKIKNIIKKYYNEEIEEEEIERNTNLYYIKDNKMQQDTKQNLQTDSYGNTYYTINVETINTDDFSYGLLDNVEENGDIIILTEKVIFIRKNEGKFDFYKDYYKEELLETKSSINKFNLGKFYDDLETYSYIFKKEGENYYLKQVVKNLPFEKVKYIFKDNKLGLASVKTGETIFEPKYDNIKVNNDGIVEVFTKDTKQIYKVIDSVTNKETSKEMLVETKYGLIDLEDEKLILDAVNDYIEFVTNYEYYETHNVERNNTGYISVGTINSYIYEDGHYYPQMTYGLSDKTGKILCSGAEAPFAAKKGNYIFTYSSEPVNNPFLYNIKTGELMIHHYMYDSYQFYVEKNKKWGIIDIENDKTIMDYKYDYINRVSNTNMAIVKNNGKYGVINVPNNETLINIEHDLISYRDREENYVENNLRTYIIVADNNISKVYTTDMQEELKTIKGMYLQDIRNSKYWSIINENGFLEILDDNGKLIKIFKLKINLGKYDEYSVWYNEDKYHVNIYRNSSSLNDGPDEVETYLLDIETGKYKLSEGI